jgi:hypothetical protein
MHKFPTPDQIIDALGGTSETARLCEVSPPAVTQWRSKGIPKPHLRYLRTVKPEIFSVLDAAPSPAEVSTQQDAEPGRE